MNNKIHLYLTPEQVEVVVYTLGRLPYNKVVDIMESVKSQLINNHNSNSSDCPPEGNTTPEAISPPEETA